MANLDQWPYWEKVKNDLDGNLDHPLQIRTLEVNQLRKCFNFSRREILFNKSHGKIFFDISGHSVLLWRGEGYPSVNDYQLTKKVFFFWELIFSKLFFF